MGTKISELNIQTPADGTEYVECIIPPYTAGTNRRITTQDIANLAGGGGAVDSVNGRTGVVTGLVDTVNAATALTDAASIDLTAIKHTLTTSSSRTFTISYTGDDITLIVTLNATTATQTFPATSLCVSEGIATGDNTCPMAGVSGDKYAIAIKRIGSDFIVVCKNVGQ